TDTHKFTVDCPKGRPSIIVSVFLSGETRVSGTVSCIELFGRVVNPTVQCSTWSLPIVVERPHLIPILIKTPVGRAIYIRLDIKATIRYSDIQQSAEFRHGCEPQSYFVI